MYCSKCGNKLDENAKFCTKCGASVDNGVVTNHSNEYNYSYNYSNISDEDLKNAYIGNNSDKIIEGKFSVPAFFFGAYYLLFRKMWLYGISWIVLIIAGEIFIPDYVSFISLALAIIMGITFNRMYLQTIDQKIDKLKQLNMDKNKQELLKICKQKGGTSVGGVILSMIVIFISAIILVFCFAYDEFKDDYNSTIEKTETVDNSDLTYNIPKGFETSKYNSNTYKSYSYYGDNDYCNINIENYSSSIYETAEAYLKSHVYTSQNEQVSEISSDKINDFEWKHLEISSDTKKEYNYATIYNDRLYKIDFTIYRDDTKLCSNGYNNFIKSLSFGKDKNDSSSV